MSTVLETTSIVNTVIKTSESTTVLKMVPSDKSYIRSSKGKPGEPGKTAYQVALDNGFVGTADEWLLSLNGGDAYKIALDNGFVGTSSEWLASLNADIVATLENSGMVLSSDGVDFVWDVIDKTYIGLSEVDNTSDINKPISIDTQTELNLKVNRNELPSLTFDIVNDPTFIIEQGEL